MCKALARGLSVCQRSAGTEQGRGLACQTLPAHVSQDTSEEKVIHFKDCMTTRCVNPTALELLHLAFESPLLLAHTLEQAFFWAVSQPGAWLSDSVCFVLSWVPVAIILPVCVP